METIISILRGINVSGHRQIKMPDLKALYEKLGYTDIVTYIQSGNVIFKTNKKTSDIALAKAIEQAIEKKYGFDVPVITRSITEIEKLIVANPFLKQKGVDAEKLHVTFLSDKPDAANAKTILAFDYSPDKFIVSGKEVYVYCPNGYGNTKLSNTFFENKLKVKATTRNWKTVNKLLELSGENKTG